jgi:putative endonuclease
MNKIAFGNLGEDIACGFLKKNGYKVVERGYKCRAGEIDIIARKGKSLVFVEVKSRSADGFGGPASAVGRAKQRKIVSTAIYYLKERKIKPKEISFDVLAIVAGNVKHIKNAFVPDRFAI